MASLSRLLLVCMLLLVEVTSIYGQAAHPTRLLVRYKSTAKKTSGKTIGGKSLRSLKIRAMNRRRGETRAAAIRRIKRDKNVAYVEPDYVVKAVATVNDPSYADQWALPKIDLPSAWELGTGSTSVKVCVIDTGVDTSHQDLSANTVSGYNAISDGRTAQTDDNGHGSHCAGVIGATTNNTIGIAGVNVNVQIIPCKFLDSSGSGFLSDAIECIDYCQNAGAVISSNSWGSTGESQALKDAVSRVTSAGQLFIVAAGNEATNNDGTSNTVSYPAAYGSTIANMISVAATGTSDNLASFSSYGASSTHIGAPGVNILSTVPGNSYDTYSGTSMATPHVAGVAALMKAANPSLTAFQIKLMLLESADPASSLAGKVSSGGRLNAYNAMLLATGATEDPTAPAPAPEEGEAPAPEEGEAPAPEEGEAPAPEEGEAPAPEEGEAPAPEIEKSPRPRPPAFAPGPGSSGSAPGKDPNGPGNSENAPGKNKSPNPASKKPPAPAKSPVPASSGDSPSKKPSPVPKPAAKPSPKPAAKPSPKPTPAAKPSPKPTPAAKPSPKPTPSTNGGGNSGGSKKPAPRPKAPNGKGRKLI